VRTAVALAALLILGLVGVAGAALNVPLGDLKPAVSEGMNAQVEILPVVEGKAAARLSFDKTGDERRLLAVRAVPAAGAAGVLALSVQCELTMEQGQAPRLALIAFEKSGASFYKVGGAALPSGESEARLSVASLRKTAFSQGANEMALGELSYVWLGVVIDGPAKGAVRLTAPRLTDEPYKPTKPLVITGEDPGKWSVGQDPAVKSTLTTPNEGPEGKACMKYEFEFPGGRHMYAIPRVEMPAGDVEGYTALKLTYKADIPEPITGLLLTVCERGGAQYCAEPPPPPTAGEWKTLTIPFANFRLGGWTKDANGQLDLPDVVAVTCGLHGAAKDAVGKGTIWATDIQFVP